MRSFRHAIFAIAAMLCTVFASGASFAQTAQPSGETTKSELHVSKDGHTILDRNGKVVARFANGFRVQPAAKSTSADLPGCLRCKPECVIYQGEKCVQSIQSCTWDFDCK